MKTHLAGRLLIAGALAVAPLALHAQAQQPKSGAVSPAAPTATDTKGSDPLKPAGTADGPDRTASPTQGAPATLSANVEEILKMVAVNVSPEVIKMYIENAPMACPPTAADIMALKEHAVTDDITTALVKRGAEARMQARKTEAEAAATRVSPPPPNPNPAVAAHPDRQPVHTLDPESYDYFNYYYLQPRTLASVYQRLSPYYPPSSRGYYRPPPYSPYLPAGVPPPRHNGLQPSPSPGGQPFGPPR